jgi:hypothetical protein
MMKRHDVRSILVVVVIVMVGYALYRWKTAASLLELGDRPANASAVGSGVSSGKPTQITPVVVRSLSAPVTPAQLHAAFRKAQQCADASSTIKSLKSLSNCTFLDGKPEFAKAYADCVGEAAAVHKNLAVARASMVGCGEESGLMRRYFVATKTAAEAGDTDAQMCYVFGGFATQEGDFAYTDAEMAEYRATAPRYMDAALQRGDWRVVKLLSFHIVDWAGPWAFLDQWQDPAREYEAQRLLRLGAAESYAQDLDNLYSDRQYPDAIKTAGDARAQETYEKYFSSQPKLTKEPQTCSSEGATR